jgi:cytochrome c oxidase subunit 3
MAENQTYYVPEQSKWPIVATVGLGVTLYGAAAIMVNGQQGESTTGSWVMFLIGSLIMAYMLFGWFGTVIKESRSGLYSPQMDRSFRWGMSWFIFSEVMFFAAFFRCPVLHPGICGALAWRRRRPRQLQYPLGRFPGDMAADQQS